MRIRFVKMSGTGNDFVVVDNRDRKIRNKKDLAIRMCHRHDGIGADGLLLLERSRKASYALRYFNADGTDGGMCGNGARCIASFAYSRRLAGKDHTLEALGRIYSAKIGTKGEVSIGFPDLHQQCESVKPHKGLKGLSKLWYIDTGSPHAVTILTKGMLGRIDVEQRGRELRTDRAFGRKGTNVNFIEVLSPKRLKIRTYERGVEAETMACGTGSIASAIIAHEFAGSSNTVSVLAPGGTLKVSFLSGVDGYRKVLLTGSVKTVFKGVYEA